MMLHSSDFGVQGSGTRKGAWGLGFRVKSTTSRVDDLSRQTEDLCLTYI